MPSSQASSCFSLNSWHVQCATPKEQQHAPAAAKVEETCATPHADAAACAPAVAEPEVDDIAKHVDSDDEVANMSQQEQLMLSPAQFRDIATGEPISNQRRLYVCQELARIQGILQEGNNSYKRVTRDTPGSKW